MAGFGRAGYTEQPGKVTLGARSHSPQEFRLLHSTTSPHLKRVETRSGPRVPLSPEQETGPQRSWGVTQEMGLVPCQVVNSNPALSRSAVPGPGLSQLSMPGARSPSAASPLPGSSVSQRSHRSRRPQPLEREQREGQLSATTSTSTCYLHPNRETAPLHPCTRCTHTRTRCTHTHAQGLWRLVRAQAAPCPLAILVVRKCKEPCKLACFFPASFHLPQTRTARVLGTLRSRDSTLTHCCKVWRSKSGNKNPQRPRHSFFLLKAGSKRLCVSKRGNWL